MEKLNIEMINGDKGYKAIYDKVGINLLYAFIATEKKLRDAFGDIQMLVEPYICDKTFLKKIDIMAFPFINICLIEDENGNIKAEEGLG